MIPFHKPYINSTFGHHLADLQIEQLGGNGPYTAKCHQFLENKIGCRKAFLTNSCTSALEMAALLLNIKEGDEIIMPSYTFASTANAFVLRGGIPVFVDISEDTLCMDETKIEDAITKKTKVIVPVHYGGVSCEMHTIVSIAEKHHLFAVEDAAQGLLAYYKGRPLGSIGCLGAVSFHETKDISVGDGGVLLINDPQFEERAEILWYKGTDKIRFLRGEIKQYGWSDIGSSFLPNELTAAFLYYQLLDTEKIIKERIRLWDTYYDSLEYLEEKGYIRRPFRAYGRNAHIFYILVQPSRRDHLLRQLVEREVQAAAHYIPLHQSSFGKRYTRIPLPISEKIAKSIIRLPLWYGMTGRQIDYVINQIWGLI